MPLRPGTDRLLEQAGMRVGRRTHIPSSHAALNVAELARERGVHEQVHERLMSAYWAEGRDIGDHGVLVDEAGPFGLDPDEIREVAASGRYEDRIAASTAAVLEMGAGGVPAFVVDDRVLIPGAQPHELFERVLGKLGYEGGEVDTVP